MGLNFRKKLLLREEVKMTCPSCKLAYDENLKFCSRCGQKLTRKTLKVYANIGNNGISSISYKTPDGITFNSKGRTTFPLGNGLSYTSSSKKK